MREIKFRGQAISDVAVEYSEGLLCRKGDWMFGSLIVSHGDYFIVGDIVEASEEGLIHEWWIKVDPATVGQCAGLKDKNVKEIYEGDVLTSEHYPFQDEGKHNYHAVVYWMATMAAFGYELVLANNEKRGISHGFAYTFDEDADDKGVTHFQVIGNIHENPELLTE